MSNTPNTAAEPQKPASPAVTPAATPQQQQQGQSTPQQPSTDKPGQQQQK